MGRSRSNTLYVCLLYVTWVDLGPKIHSSIMDTICNCLGFHINVKKLLRFAETVGKGLLVPTKRLIKVITTLVMVSVGQLSLLQMIRTDTRDR